MDDLPQSTCAQCSNNFADSQLFLVFNQHHQHYSLLYWCCRNYGHDTQTHTNLKQFKLCLTDTKKVVVNRFPALDIILDNPSQPATYPIKKTPVRLNLQLLRLVINKDNGLILSSILPILPLY